MAVTSAAQAGPSTRFVCRSYMAMVLTPQPPIVEWVGEIEQKIKGAAHLFIGPPVVLDMAAVKLSQSAIAHLVAQLEERGVRVMGLENVDAAATGAGVPPLVRSSRGVGTSVDVDHQPQHGASAGTTSRRRHALGRQTGPLGPDDLLSLMATLPCSVRSGPAPNSSPAARSMFMALCVDASWRAPTGIRAREYSAAKLKPSFWQSTGTI